jgi:hypothetical protein
MMASTKQQPPNSLIWGHGGVADASVVGQQTIGLSKATEVQHQRVSRVAHHRQEYTFRELRESKQAAHATAIAKRKKRERAAREKLAQTQQAEIERIEKEEHQALMHRAQNLCHAGQLLMRQPMIGLEHHSTNKFTKSFAITMERLDRSHRQSTDFGSSLSQLRSLLPKASFERDMSVYALPASEARFVHDFCQSTNVYDQVGWEPKKPFTWRGARIENGHIVSIELPNRKIEGVLPNSIGGLKQLQRIDLDSNDLTGEVPTSIGMCTKLRSLRLGCNQFSSMPDSIGNCAQLGTLELRSNRFSGNPPTSIGNLSLLVTLSLESNQFVLPADVNIRDTKRMQKDLRARWKVEKKQAEAEMQKEAEERRRIRAQAKREREERAKAEAARSAKEEEEARGRARKLEEEWEDDNDW